MKREIIKAIEDYFRLNKEDILIDIDVWQGEITGDWYITTISITPRKIVFKETWKYKPENLGCKIEFHSMNGYL